MTDQPRPRSTSNRGFPLPNHDGVRRRRATRTVIGAAVVMTSLGAFGCGDAHSAASAADRGASARSAPVDVAAIPTASGVPVTAAPALTSSPREFDAPSGLAFGGGRLWVTNEAGNSVTAINPANGGWIRTIRGPSYGFDHPTAITLVGTDLFVTNGGGSVTELRASTGALVRRISGARYGFYHPIATKAAGSTLLVLNAGPAGGAGSITEIATGSGALRRVISGRRFGFTDPAALTVVGPDAFVANTGNNSVTEVGVPGGTLIRRVTNWGLSAPDGISNGDGHLWVADRTTSSATEIDAASGRVLQTISSPIYGFGHPTVTISNGNEVYVATPLGTSPMVTKLSAADGAFSWYMCNTNGPYYFSQLSALAVSGDHLWVASSSGANSKQAGARTGSLTEMYATSGALIRTVP